ncbi:hypothetical protein GCM10029964_056560 [Kibdelosporangium lantanae]
MQALDELDRRGDLTAQDVHHPVRRLGPGRVQLTVHIGHHGHGGRPERQPRSTRLSGSLAGATIDVWNAWLTGSRTAVRPIAANVRTAASTTAVAPPITAWPVLLTLATTT